MHETWDLPRSLKEEGKRKKEKGTVMGRCTWLATVPGGVSLLIRVSIDDRHAKPVFSPSLPVGERSRLWLMADG